MAKKTQAKRALARKPARRAKAPARQKIAPVPPKYGSITPALVIRGAADAIDFYRRAFGAKELMRTPGPGGKLMHAEIKIGDSIVMLNDEFPEMGAKSPQALGGTPASIMLYVKDCDAVHRAAVAAGARSLQEPQDMFWGDRYSRLEDPFGHQWGIGTAKEKLTRREIDRRMQAWQQQQGAPQG